MKIRDFKDSDAEKMAALSNKNAPFFQYNRVSPAFIRDMANASNYRFFVLSEGSGVIGFCGVRLPSKMHKDAELGPICVESGRRMQGLGRLLIDTVIEDLEERGIASMIIKVRTSNIGAQEFFSTIGFRKIGGTLVDDIPAIEMRYGLERPQEKKD